MPRSNENEIELTEEMLYGDEGGEPPSPRAYPRGGRLSRLGHQIRGIALLVAGYYAITYGVMGYNVAYKWGNDRLNGVVNSIVEAKLGNFELILDNKGKPVNLSEMDRATLERHLVLISGQYRQCLEAQGEISAISQSFAGRLYNE